MKDLLEMSREEFIAAAMKMTPKERRAAIKAIRASQQDTRADLRRVNGEIEVLRFNRMWEKILALAEAAKDRDLCEEILWFLKSFKWYVDRHARDNNNKDVGRASGAGVMKKRGQRTRQEVLRLYPKAKQRGVPEASIPQWINDQIAPEIEKGKAPRKPATGTIKNVIAVLKAEKRI
jgi:hypothetical protein